jgi:hypothetical protein
LGLYGKGVAALAHAAIIERLTPKAAPGRPPAPGGGLPRPADRTARPAARGVLGPAVVVSNSHDHLHNGAPAVLGGQPAASIRARRRAPAGPLPSTSATTTAR